MVDIEAIYMTMSTIAVLTVPPQLPMSIDQKELEGVLNRPVSVIQSPTALVISSQRDQIEAIVSGSKINIRDLSGSQTFSQSKIPTVLDFFMQRFALPVISYGINFVFSVPCKDAARWIGDNILAPQISERTGLIVSGSAATLRISFGNKTWNVKLEPSSDDTIAVDFNASEQTQQLPEPSIFVEELQEQFEALLKLLNNLGL